MLPLLSNTNKIEMSSVFIERWNLSEPGGHMTPIISLSDILKKIRFYLITLSLSVAAVLSYTEHAFAVDELNTPTSNIAATTLSINGAASKFTPEQQAEIGEIAANWLVQHPEYLAAASQSLRQQQQDADAQMQKITVLKNAALLLEKNTPVIGPEDAKVVVVVFFDYQCDDCGVMNTLVLQMRKEFPGVRFMFREHASSANSVMFAYAARVGQAVWLNKAAEGYWGYYNALLNIIKKNKVLSENDIHHVGEMYLDDKQLSQTQTESLSPSLQQRIEQNNALGNALQLTEPPSFIVLPVKNATTKTLSVLDGTVTEEGLRQAILRAEI